MDNTARHMIFIGRVQGVGFRFTARNIAQRHGLAGFVRNLPDGTVELLAQGPSQAVDDCLTDLQDAFAGYIRDTRVEQVPYDSRYSAFSITF